MFQDQSKVAKIQKSRNAIGKVSEKDISKIIKGLRKLRNYLLRRRGPNVSLL